MADDQTDVRKPIEHRVPTPRTVKQLYGTAFRCGEPSCMRPLYRMNDQTGAWILNSRVAHIHARSEGGPRWNPQMSEEDNRSASNLIPLCEQHASEIDVTPEHFPAELLREWKKAQLAEYRDLGKPWPGLGDAEAAEIVAASFDHHKIGQATTTANAVASVARQVGLLIETGRIQRRRPQAAVRAWQELHEQTNRSTFVYNTDGERLRVEPSHYETERYRAALETALAEATTVLEPTATQLIAELHAVSAVDQHLAPWCTWVEEAVRHLVIAAGRWPGRPPEEDDNVWPDVQDELLRASKALSARWRGEEAPAPPSPAPPLMGEVESDRERALREHEELLESARPWARVTHRPYDAALYQHLVEAAEAVVELPYVVSFLTTGLDATARLAARVARNADDNTYRDLIWQAKTRRPFAVAVNLLRELMFVAQDAERSVLEAEAKDAIFEILTTETWRDPAVWSDNRVHVRRMLGWTASITSDQAVRERLAAAIDSDPGLLSDALRGLAQWIERVDISGTGQRFETTFQVDDLPTWIPIDVLVATIHEHRPHVVPADEDGCRHYQDEVDRLAAQMLWLASRPGTAP